MQGPLQHARLQRAARDPGVDGRARPTARHRAFAAKTCVTSAEAQGLVGRMTAIVLQSGGLWGTLAVRSRSGVAGLLPLRHLGSTDSFALAGHEPWPFTALSNTRSTRRTG